MPFAEALENRRLLTTTSTWHATNTNPYDVQNGPLANLGATLIGVYKDYSTYVNSGSTKPFNPTNASLLYIKGTSVGVDVIGIGTTAAVEQTLSTLGMSVTATSATNNLYEGYIPIANLPKLAVSAQVRSASAMIKPVFSAYPYQGVGNNEGANTLNVPTTVVAGATNGAGQKIGVLSDSDNQYAGGLADSQKTGDLGAVQTIQDGPAGSTDEGRAMLEEIHDIAPGAALGFASASYGEAGAAANIVALGTAGYGTIVDDFHYPDEPVYQDGTVAQAVNTVVANGSTYLASAGNSADDGYESQFRGVNATVGVLGAGRFMNFDPTGTTTTTQLGVYVPNDGSQAPNIYFQFDQPFYGGATSDVEVYLLNSSGAIAYSGTTNTAASGEPIQVFADATGNADIAPGTYTAVVQVVSGSDPGHISFYNPTDGEAAFDHKFGSAGGTFYPTTNGHNAAANTISVGAVPFWGAAPYITTSTPANEPYSSFGPVLSLFNPDGSVKTPQTLLKPDVSSADFVNTSFFIPGQITDTTVVQSPANPEYPGNAPTTSPDPVTPTNVAQTAYPTFSGTSAAAPNLAAVVALMKQANPTITRSTILQDLTTSASPLNGSAKGTWNAQGGYGLANATAAISLASVLQVNSTTPGETATVTTAPTYIDVDFSKPVNLAFLSNSSIRVAGANGATVTIGAPIGEDSTTFPTIVRFPITINPAANRIANGIYTVIIPAGAVQGQDGKLLASPFTTTFNLQDTIAPRIASTSFSGRILTVTFDSAVNPALVNVGDIYLIRAGGANNALFGGSTSIVSTAALGATFSYNPATFTATINLTNVPQSALPSDHYAIVATSSIQDQVGNPLNGQFSGVFPSGVANPATGVGSNFVQDLGVLSLQAPSITSLVLAPTSDSGVAGDSDTNVATPAFIGQVAASFPSTNAGLTVYAEFNGITHAGLALGGLNLGVGTNGVGVVGTYDVTTTTDANGAFTINYPAGVSALPEGQNIIRVVVVGASTNSGPGLATVLNTTFQVDRTDAYVSNAELNGAVTSTVAEGSNISGLTTASIYVTDPVNPQSLVSPFAVNAQSKITALNPATADNVLNYQLRLMTGTNSYVDYSSYIKTATFVSTSNRVLTSDPLTGRVDLTFASGLPQGTYALYVLGTTTAPASGGGVTDAAGNTLTDTAADSATGTVKPFEVGFHLQPVPTYITGYTAYNTYASATNYGVTSGPRASYEIPAAGVTPGAPAPPTAFTIDFSNQLAATTASVLANEVELVRSANSATANPDGDFGNFGTAAGLTNPTGFTRVSGLNVQLVNSIPSATVGQYGYLNRLLITIPTGTSLPSDYYRIYLPNTSSNSTAITDIYGTQLDGEFQGYQNAAGVYVDQLNTGAVRGTASEPDLSGDGSPGGAFVTGFVVVPNGNIIYARPDAIYNPQLPSTYPDGTAAKPYPVLAPEATTTTLNGGDLNSVLNSGINFDPTYDRSGLGTFQPSAFFAAQEKARLTLDPVVIIAEPALVTRDPVTGVTSQRPFVLQAPNTGSSPIANDGSAAVPAMTTLIFAQGSTLKMQNAALLVQNQGSALQIEGGPNPAQMVNITSYKDSSIGGATNGDPSTVPASGDYGGILFRNYDQAAGENATNTAGRSTLFPGQIPTTGNLTQDGRLKGPFTNSASRTSQVDAVSGADDVMSYIDFLTEKYAGGTVPQSDGIAYDGITLQNSRPTVVNTAVAFSGVASTSTGGAANAGISEDVDSARLDDVAAGPLFRNITLSNNGINGIYIRGNLTTGLAQASNATDVGTTTNSIGGARQFIFNSPIPYVLTTSLTIGLDLIVGTQGTTVRPADRLYINPGTILKFSSGSGMEVLRQASLNVGDHTYLNGYDQNASYSPTSTGFKANSAGLAQVIFTSFYDDAATTSYTDPISGVTSIVTPALSTVPGGAGSNLPSAGNVPSTARWSGLTIDSGGVAVINSATFRYGGGFLNSQAASDNGQGSDDFHHALELSGGGIDSYEHFADPEGTQSNYVFNPYSNGARVMVTNDTFTDNLDVGLDLSPQALLATDPTRPLQSGAPFIHGNIFLRNVGYDGLGLNGVGVAGGTGLPVAGTHLANLNYNSTWSGGDFTYILRDTIVLGPDDFGIGVAAANTGSDGEFSSGIPPVPSATVLGTTPTPNVTLTLQSTLPGTVLADGTVVAAPGAPLIIKTLNNGNSPIPAETIGTTPGANTTSSWAGGAGFIVGVDDGTDPPTPGEDLLDDGEFSQIRILGIGGNGTQTRVPVTITSIYDNTVGTTVGNTVMNNVTGTATPAKAGNGGIIYFGGNSLTSYNLEDPRSGSIIDNADIKYMTRIEQQGGGIVYTTDLNGDGTYDATNDDPYADRAGPTNSFFGTNFQTQYNKAKSLTISDSNLSSFSDGGVVSHPGYGILAINDNYAVAPSVPTGAAKSITPTVLRVSGITGEPAELFLVNDTITNMDVTGGRDVGLDIVSQTGDDNPGDASVGTVAVVLNSTFYNDGIGVNATAQAFDGVNPYSEIAFLGMDSIFANNRVASVQLSGDQFGSDLQYNLFNANGNNNLPITTNAQFITESFNAEAYTGDPDFRNAAGGDFTLLSGSAAIDRSRESLNDTFFGNLLSPAATDVKTTVLNGVTYANNVNFLPVRNQTGDNNLFGGDGNVATASDIVTLPGASTTARVFPDLWVETLNITPLPTATATNVVQANSSNPTSQGTVGNGYFPGTYAFVPIYGPRDQNGTLRGKDPNSNNVGSGTHPFYDLGAFEYVLQTPPVVTGVTAVSAAGTSTSLYTAGAIAGTNVNPSQIKVAISERLNAATLTSSSVQLVGSGGDGIFGNANDITYNLANRISFDNTTDSIVINTTGLLPTGSALNDEYMLTLKGTGSNAIRDNNNFALDGYTNNDNLPLPSGSDNLPGSDFSVSFTIDTNPPSLVSGSFFLASGTYGTAINTAGANNIGPVVTNSNKPTFVGKITDIFPPADPVEGDKVYVDISTTGDPNNFNVLNAATGTTDATGNFSVTVNTALPDSPWAVGPDGKQGTPDDTGTTLARVRIVDQAGNVSDLVTDSLATFAAKGAAFGFEIDTKPPQVTAVTPSASTLATVNSSGQLIITATFSKNIDPTTLNANSVLVSRSGGSGTFTGTGTPVTIVPGSFAINYLGGTKGPVQVSFAVQSPVNDFYRVVLKGTGTSPIKDIAGNALDGLGTGVAGSGDYTTGPFTVFTPSAARLIYVDDTDVPSNTKATLGSRENPYTTIAAALTAANVGDDVLVLPGTYYENITLKGQVRLLSAATTSTDTSYSPGNPRNTIIYGNTNAGSTNNTKTGITVVSATNLATIPGEPTEISGFTILDALLGDSVRGVIDTTSVGISLNNSFVTVDKNYIVNAGIGINVLTNGSNVSGPLILTNVIAGNYSGIGIADGNTTISYASPTQVINNTIVDNTYGLYNVTNKSGTVQANVINNIFYGNHDTTTARAGTGILSTAPNTLTVGSNLFYANGANNTVAASAQGTFTGFNPASLSAKPDIYGNLYGNPYFVLAEDPRPTADSPPVFFLYANYDLSSQSPAINQANNASAPATDILYRKAVAIAGKGTAGTGPASIGAFYYLGTGGISVTTTGTGSTAGAVQSQAITANGSNSAGSGSSSIPIVGGSLPIGTRQFAVVNTSLNPDGSASGTATSISAPSSITVNFSDNVAAGSLTANDLTLTGSGLSSTNPAKASSLTWIDSHTVKFLLTGGFNSTGSLNLAIPAGAVKDTAGDSIAAFAEAFTLGSSSASATPTSTASSTPATTTTAQPAVIATPSVSLPIQPIAVAGPIAVHYTTAVTSSKAHTAKAQAAATAKHEKQVEAAKAAAKAQAAKHAATVAKAHAKTTKKAK